MRVPQGQSNVPIPISSEDHRYNQSMLAFCSCSPFLIMTDIRAMAVAMMKMVTENRPNKSNFLRSDMLVFQTIYTGIDMIKTSVNRSATVLA